jgi:hypothetical protein
LIGCTIDELQTLFHVSPDSPKLFQAIGAAAGSFLYSRLPAFLPFRKGENFREKLKEAVVEGEPFFGLHNIPAIPLERIRDFLRMARNGNALLSCPPERMGFGD